MKDGMQTDPSWGVDAEQNPKMIAQARALTLRIRELCGDLPFDDEPASFLKALEHLADPKDDASG